IRGSKRYLDSVAPGLVFVALDLVFVVLGLDSIAGDLEIGAPAESTRSQRKRGTADCLSALQAGGIAPPPRPEERRRRVSKDAPAGGAVGPILDRPSTRRLRRRLRTRGRIAHTQLQH